MPLPLRKLTASLALLPFVLNAQTFNGGGAAIPDDGNTLELALEVSGLPAALDTTAFGLEQVCFTIEHSWISDLDIRLVAPDGTTRVLVQGQGGDSDHFDGTCLRADATTPITEGSSPYSGTYRPQGQMGAVNNGQDGNGTWRLRILDTWPFADAGAVLTWSITFGTAPAHYLSFPSYDLPLVLINTNNTPIPDAEKIPATMGIVDNGSNGANHVTDPFNGYSGHIGIELRGYSSQNAPKKSYGIELRDDLGEDLDSPLLGMPAESDWVLSANHFDKSLLNNTLTYHLARAMGHYAARHRHVEVILDGEYLGVYVLMERIKRGGDRLDIAKLNPDETFGDDLTGGYILNVDRDAGEENGFFSAFEPVGGNNDQQVYLEYRYPKPEDIVEEQRTYIQEYLNAFETALAGPGFADPQTGYAAYADALSFVDVFLLNEYSRNVDGYRLSSHLYKDKDSNGGLLHAGPVWDYDLGWGNADYCNGSDIDGWAYRFSEVCPGSGQQVPFWWSRLLDDPHYRDLVRCRWNELRDGLLSPTNIAAYCDSVAAVLEQAQQRNFITWPILGTYVWPNPSPIPTTYAGEIQELKDFALARFNWLDTHLPQSSADCGAIGLPEPGAVVVGGPFPNPFTDHVMLTTVHGAVVQVELLDATGRRAIPPATLTGTGPQRLELLAALAPGTYMLLITDAYGSRNTFRLQH